MVVQSHRPGLGEKLFFLASGIVVSIPIAFFFEPSIAFLRHFFPNLQGFQAEILLVVVLAPMIEEFAKAYPLFYRHGESQRSLFALGFLVGLGFGITEFFEYVVLLNVSPLIRLPGIFFHAATTSIIAYGIATKRSGLLYLIAFALHSSINFVSIFDMPELLYALVMATAFLLSLILYTKTSEKMIPY
jgi:hypothetical protein